MIKSLTKSRLYTLLDLSKKAFGAYTFEIMLLTILGFVSGLVEGLGVNALIPLLSLALDTAPSDVDFITRTIKGLFIRFDISFSIRNLLVLIASLFVIRGVATLALGYIKVKIITDYEEKTRKELFRTTLNASWPHLVKQKLGHLETILMIDVPASGKLFREIGTAITIVTGLIIYLAFAINVSLLITLSTLALGLVVFFILKPIIFRIRKLAYKIVKTNKMTAHLVSENVLGVKTIKAMHMADSISLKGNELFARLRQLEVTRSMYNLIPASIIPTVGVLYIIAVFALSYKSPALDVIALPVIVYLIHKIFTYIQQLQRNAQLMNALAPHTRSVINCEEAAAQTQEQVQGVRHSNFNEALVFDNVSFTYEEDKALSEISLSIKKGEMIGIIGPSGAGKTTLVDLILRLYQPQKGAISIDGTDIGSIRMDEWRKTIGYVSQDIFLANDTIEENIRFYDPSVTKEDVIDAAKKAHIYDFIQSQKNGLNTLVGERGIMLSAGQRQRIVIARILARKPSLLILDEATSALDNESEVKIQKVIEELKGKITVLVIAHRLSTIKESDRLLVLDKGELIEEGKPNLLLKNKDSYFYKVYTIRE